MAPAEAPAGAPPAPEEDTGPPKFRDPQALIDEVGPELAAQIERVAPRPPTFVNVNDEAQLERWEACAKLGAATALHHGEGQPEREQAGFAFHAAQALYEDDSFTL